MLKETHVFSCPMPSPLFSILYADPPWRYHSVNVRPRSASAPEQVNRVAPPPYSCLSTRTLCQMPIASLCAPDCLLFLWTTYPMLPDALKVIAAWGFEYRTCAFTWVKQNPSLQGYHFGTGYWTRANPELCLLGVKGHPKRQRADVRNLVISPRREHSRKPDEVRDRIVALCGDLPRLELFARQKTPGWKVWGNEVQSDIVLTVPISAEKSVLVHKGNSSSFTSA